LSSKCSPSCNLHLAHIECLLISHDWHSLIYWRAKLGLKSNGLSEHSCSHSHIAQCFLDKSHSTLMASCAAFLWSISFLRALVIGLEMFCSELKSKFSSSLLSLWLFSLLLSEKNFFSLITFNTLDLPLVSLTSVIFAGYDHLGVSFRFLPSGVKSSYQTRSYNLNECGRAFLSKLSL
jgi:hypothetical protein